MEGRSAATRETTVADSTVRIGLVLPEVMGTYGDGGNSVVLRQRLRLRGVDAEIVEITLADPVPSSLDLYTLGGAEDYAQRLATKHLIRYPGLQQAAAHGAPVLAICAAIQVLGHWYETSSGERVDGVGLLDLTDVRDGLAQTPKSLPPKWFYDSVGSELFDQITRLPEYYPTRAEAEILRGRSAEIAAASGADTLVELGSGTSEKTRILLDALRDSGSLRRFIPFDVDAGVLEAAGAALQHEYPTVEIDAVCGDFEEHLGKIPRVGRRLVVFLGSTIGNLTPEPRAEFLSALSDTLQPGDSLLLGTDLVKDAGRLVRAYDDSAGVTARFNRNVLAVVNRELDADFDLDAFEHVARWNTAEERIEMWLRADSAQRVWVGALELTVDFAAGEEMLTEVSCKFRPEGVGAELAEAGLRRTHWWADAAGDFGLSLSTK